MKCAPQKYPEENFAHNINRITVPQVQIIVSHFAFCKVNLNFYEIKEYKNGKAEHEAEQ